MRCDTVWTDTKLATMADGTAAVVDHALVAATDGRIVFAGPADAAPHFQPCRTVPCDGRLVTPGLIDCHTHLIHGGDRAHEFELRLAGVSYEQIAQAGGGIVSTMRATRDAGEDELVRSAAARLDALIAEGVTTIEIKSGYGLDRASELRMLRAARRLGVERPVQVRTTFLGAHALPPEFGDDPEAYIDLVCDEMLPAAKVDGLVDAVDAFCEGIGFNLAQTERVFRAAAALGLPVKLHAEQLSDMHGAALAARYGALSADHLEHLDAYGIAAMAAAGTVATLLPGAFYFVRETKMPPVEGLRAAGIPIAIATDYNPGTAPLTSILLAMNMAATLFRLTVDECLVGATRNAARALGLSNRIGTIEAGKACDLAIWNVDRPAELVYRMGFNSLHARVWRGR